MPLIGSKSDVLEQLDGPAIHDGSLTWLSGNAGC